MSYSQIVYNNETKLTVVGFDGTVNQIFRLMKCLIADKTDIMEDNLAATFDAGNSFNTKLRDTLQGLLAANNERKSEIDALRGDHETLKGEHEALVNTTERENSLR